MEPILQETQVSDAERFIVVPSRKEMDTAGFAPSAYAEIAELLCAQKLKIVHERIFGSLESREQVMSSRRQSFEAKGLNPDNPTTYIEGHPPWGKGIAGVIVHAVSDENVWTVLADGIPCGRGWRCGDGTYLMLQNIQGLAQHDQKDNSWPTQTRRLIERAERILSDHGMTYRNTVRTWFYLSDILDWYEEFNPARSAKYAEFGIMPDPEKPQLLLPASTGIRGDNPEGAAAAMDLLAISPGSADHAPRIEKLSNSGQKDAFKYGSAFSRGAIIHRPDVSLLQLSGTAAINERGQSLYPGDARSQINCTLDKIDSLLQSKGASLSDIAAATAFVKRAEDATLFYEIATQRGLGDLPCVCVVADICRDELLFELDGEIAIKPG